MENNDNWISGDWIAEKLGCPYKINGHNSLDYVQGSDEENVKKGQKYHMEYDLIIPKELELSNFKQTGVGNIFSTKKGDVLLVHRSANINNETVSYDPELMIDLGDGQYHGETENFRSYHEIKKS